MYTTSDIAFFLGTERSNVNYYIRKGYLKATMFDGNYEITEQDYHSFRDKYYDTDKRNSARGINKKLSQEQVVLLASVISDLQNSNISLECFKQKYKKDTELIPQFNEYLIYKRDMCIRYDNHKKGYRYQKLANEYGLSLRSIQEIINQNKKSEFQEKEYFFNFK